jgi:hypothetical protein
MSDVKGIWCKNLKMSVKGIWCKNLKMSDVILLLI